jgi:tetratricopeptide (TPR) repeat protein
MTISVESARDSALRASVVEVDVDHGPAASYTGLRHALAVLRAEGAGFGDLPYRYGGEWAQLFPGEAPGAPRLEDIALAASERRLHRESEQVYRVLSVAAAALCTGSAELGKTVAVRGVGGTDLSSLRGFMLAVERASVTPGARLEMIDPARTRIPAGLHADYRAERVRCLRRMGLPVTVDDLTFDLAELPDDFFAPVSEEGELYFQATDPDSSRVDRIAAALAYSRRAFFSANWEGMAIVAKDAIGLLRGLSDGHVPEVLDKAERKDGLADAIEFETVILRSTADVRAFLLKVLGIQASFRGDQDAALGYFRAMRAAETGLSAELISQSHLYTALTLSKRKLQLPEAVAELDQGFAVVRSRPGEPDSVRRERGWLHNLRGLTLFAQKRLVAALEHEKQALACLEGLNDASSAHLRINLYSNISVLQEKADKLPQALTTWEKFKQVTGSANAGFRKHHAYRSGGIRLLIGDRAEALKDFGTTLDTAAALTDDFHECEVRLELGALHARSGEKSDAGDQFELAEIAARRMGDPYRIALAQAGQTVVTATANQAAQTALHSSTQPARAKELAKAVNTGDGVLELLPLPRTKLNRPFDLINFQD